MPTPRVIIFYGELILVYVQDERVPFRGKYINHDGTFIGIETGGKMVAIPLTMVDKVESARPRTVRDS